MAQRRKLTLPQSYRALGIIESGLRQIDVAEALGLSQSVISRLANRMRATGVANERPRSGRPKKTSPVDDRFLILQARRHPVYSTRRLAGELQDAAGVNISRYTARRRLLEVNMCSRRPLTGLVLHPLHQRQRLAWAQQHRDWQQEWRTTLFTDESRFGLMSDSRRIRIWTRRQTPRTARFIQKVAPFKGGTIMVWGGICYNGRTDLYVCRRSMNGNIYKEDIVEGVVTQFHGAIGDNFRFLDDNATAHRANIVLNRVYELGIPTLPLPPRSPDLNPIEHAWDKLQRALENHSPVPQTIAELTTLLPRLWQAIPAEDLNHLVESMPRRVEAVIEARGGWTRY